jgi:F0F1-type ATP synthase membrane subunit a
MKQIIIYSPLEQFQVFPILSFYLLGYDFSITNETVILVLVLLLTLVFFMSLFQKSGDNTLDLIPKRRQSILEIIYTAMLSLVVDNIKDKNSQKFFPLVFSLFLFILSLNLMGLIPYSFTLTSHLIVTFFISLSIFIGINIICARLHGIRMFALFLPSGTSVLLAFLLVPIELISYIFKPVSLSIRLFANMMAGHTLLKVIAGFAYVLMGNGGLLFLIQYVPLLILIPLFGLELGVALIQSFVFSILICIYLNDSINLH